MNYLPVYPDETRWLTILNVENDTVDPTTVSSARPTIEVIAKKTHVFDANFQKKLL